MTENLLKSEEDYDNGAALTESEERQRAGRVGGQSIEHQPVRSSVDEAEAKIAWQVQSAQFEVKDRKKAGKGAGEPSQDPNARPAETSQAFEGQGSQPSVPSRAYPCLSQRDDYGKRQRGST